MNCRVCKSNRTSSMGVVEYYRGFPVTIFDCNACRSRFTSHDASIYNFLYATANSSYGTYREFGDKCADFYARKELAGLRSELCAGAKYKFVIESLETIPTSSRLLEIGCSSGHLTSFFILAGCDVIAADVSAEALRRAESAFGPHFVHVNDPAIAARAPYDAIYHVGTIGCIADPVGMTHQLLALLRPGGRLLFNAPNADSCTLDGQLWVDEAPPPDVVTLFRPGFWRAQFDGIADVVETTLPLPASQSFAIGIKNYFGQKWQSPTPLPIEESLNDFKGGRVSTGEQWPLFQRVVLALAVRMHVVHVAKRRPAPFGLHVTMTKR